MAVYNDSQSVFLQKIITVIEENLTDENFGVTELAEVINMSRSNLLRKVKQETGESVSVFIRNVRLQNAKQFLKDDTLTVSEISYRVGFNSPSYFIKCFKELYGLTPNQMGREDDDKEEIEETRNEEKAEETQSFEKRKTKLIGLSVAIVIIIFGILFWVNKQENSIQKDLPKSIAVLPFKNDSSDSTNVYFMNGLMGAVLDNFQKIEDLEVTSRTTVEKYRGISKSISEMSKELNVSYFIEGSGQKVGNEVLLTIQLIEGATDRQLWSKRYHREIKDVFELQMDVAKSIANEINVIITPDEHKRIEKIPTENLVAYDYYLKGLALIKKETRDGLLDGIEQFKKAIQQDGQFAHAYAYMAISYYFLDIYQIEKKYTDEIKNYADKAKLLDKDLGETLIAKAFYFMQIKDYEQATKSFEEVLVYYPNLAWVQNMLSDIYARIIPNTEKFLKYALQGIQSPVVSEDSSIASYAYLHLSNALVQNGFLVESENYIKKSLAYKSDNLYSQYLYVFIKLAKNFDLKDAKEELIEIHKKDTTRLDVIQEVAKICYMIGDYHEAWVYYDKLVKGKKALQLDIYQSEDIKMGFVLEQLGEKKEAKNYYDRFFEYSQNDTSQYKDLNYSAYYAATGDIGKAISYFKKFTEVNNYHYWFVLFLKYDPIIRQMASHSNYKSILKKIDDKFWENHKKMREMLEEENVILKEAS